MQKNKVISSAKTKVISPLEITTKIQEISPPKETKISPKPTNYLNNKDLLAEVKLSKSKQQMTEKLAKMLQLLCTKYAKKGNFIGYTYNEDMQAYAMFMLVRTWNSFDPAKSDNAFAFFTQCIKNSFIQYLKQEKKQRSVRDQLLVDHGMNPSFGFGEDYGDKHVVDDEEDFHAHQRTAHILANIPSDEPVNDSSVEEDKSPNNEVTAEYSE